MAKELIYGNISLAEVTIRKIRLRYEHPAIFPEKLVNDHIITWTDRGDVVYDPFMGSGTVAKMAMLNKRFYVGSEINSVYYEIAQKRLTEHTDTLFKSDYTLDSKQSILFSEEE